MTAECLRASVGDRHSKGQASDAGASCVQQSRSVERVLGAAAYVLVLSLELKSKASLLN